MSAGLKIGVLAGTVLKNSSAVRHSILGYLKHSFFFYFFQLTTFGHALWNVHGQKN